MRLVFPFSRSTGAWAKGDVLGGISGRLRDSISSIVRICTREYCFCQNARRRR